MRRVIASRLMASAVCLVLFVPSAISKSAISLSFPSNFPASGARSVPPSFAGLSIEYSTLQRYLGNSEINRTIFYNLLGALSDRSGPPVLRIGGDSQDVAAWGNTIQNAPKFVTFEITPTFLDMLKEIGDRTGASFILGLNLAAGKPEIATAWAKAAQTNLPPAMIRAFELGNQPDLYVLKGYRQSGWNFDAYVSEFAVVSASLAEVLGKRGNLAGPASLDTAGTPPVAPLLTFSPDIPQFLSTFGKNLSMVTSHYYPMSACVPAKFSDKPTYPSVEHLLADRAAMTYGKISSIALGLSAARQQGVELRIAEMNAVSCQGKEGVTNTMASALWVTDALFELLKAGANGANLTISGTEANDYQAFYNPIALKDGRLRAKPELYGMLLFAEAVRQGATLIPVATAGDEAEQINVKIWAIEGGNGRRRILILNKDVSKPSLIRLPVSRSGRLPAVKRLEAPALNAEDGITFAGQAFDQQGRFSGRQVIEKAGGTARQPVVSVPAGSAALVLE